MTVSAQRSALRKSAINLDRITRSLTRFTKGISSARIQADQILKQTRERNDFKSGLVNQDEKYFRTRQENIKRKNREDALEATSITGQTKTQGAVLQKSTRGFLGRMLNFLGILLVGWSVRNLPKIIEGTNNLIKNIRRTVGILSSFMDSVSDTLTGIGTGLTEFFFKFRLFDYTLNRVGLLEQIGKILNSLFLFDKNLLTSFLNFENDPDLNKAQDDYLKNKDKPIENQEGGEEDIISPEEITTQINTDFDESKTKNIEKAIKNPFEIEGKKFALDIDKFFENRKDNKVEDGIDQNQIDNLEASVTELENKVQGLEGAFNVPYDQIPTDGSGLSQSEKEKAKIFMGGLNEVYEDAIVSLGEFFSNVDEMVVGKKSSSSENPDLVSLNPRQRNTNLNLNNRKSKRNNILIIEKEVDNGTGVNMNSGGGGIMVVNGPSIANTLNNIQSAELKYT